MRAIIQKKNSVVHWTQIIGLHRASLSKECQPQDYFTLTRAGLELTKSLEQDTNRDAVSGESISK